MLKSQVRQGLISVAWTQQGHREVAKPALIKWGWVWVCGLGESCGDGEGDREVGTAVSRSPSVRVDEVATAGTGEDVGGRWKRAEEGCVGREVPVERVGF